MKTRRFHNYLMVLLACACLNGASGADGPQGTITDAINALKTTMGKESPKRVMIPGEPEEERPDIEGYLLPQLRTLISEGNFTQAEAMLDQLASSQKADDVEQAIAKLRSAIDTEQRAKEKALTDRVDAVLAGATKAVRAAKVPADLDQAIDQLQTFQEENRGEPSSSAIQERLNKLRNVKGFVMGWQDYVAARADNPQQATQILQNLMNQGTCFDIVPRSELIAMIAELNKPKPAPSPVAATPGEDIRGILAGVKTLDEIPAAIDALSKLQRDPGYQNQAWNSPIAATINDLSTIFQTYSSYQLGLPTELSPPPGPDSGYGNQPNGFVDSATLPLRAQLLRLILPRVLDVDEKPGSDESVQAYLDRLMSKAEETVDARLISRLRKVESILEGKQDSGESAGFINSLLAARNQDAAGQYVPAVISYEIALRSGGELVPTKAIGNRLDAIKKAHGEDYDKGMQLFLSTQGTTGPAPVPQYYTQPSKPHTITVPGKAVGSYGSIASPTPAATVASPTPKSAPAMTPEPSQTPR